MKKISLISIPLLIFCLLLPALSQAVEKPVGKVIAIRGTVEFMSLGPDLAAQSGGGIKKASLVPWEKVIFQQPVFKKDQFRTSQGSRLKIVFEDNSLIALGPNSSMKIESYLYKPKEKLRQGLISIAHGLTMYIINTSQKNKKSGFGIVTPTGNIAARGTMGYVSVSANATLIANQAGSVVVSNSDPNIKGQQKVGRMMKTIIEKGKPPAVPVPLTKNELKQIRNIVMGQVGASTEAEDGEKPLIEVEEEEVEEEEEEETEETAEAEESETMEAEESTEEEATEETAEAEETTGEETDVVDESVVSEEVVASQDTTEEEVFGYTAPLDTDFVQEDIDIGDYIEIDDSYDTSFLSACSF